MCLAAGAQWWQLSVIKIALCSTIYTIAMRGKDERVKAIVEYLSKVRYI
jgi:hypothetical protein